MTTAPAAALAAPPTHGAIEPVKATQKAARLLATACQMKTACRDDVSPNPTQGVGSTGCHFALQAVLQLQHEADAILSHLPHQLLSP